MADPRSAERFADAVFRVAGFRARPVVVKLGGSAMEDPAATEACLKSVVVLNHLRVPLVLVHGGGKPIDRAMTESGLTPKKVAGRRYTDEATLAIVVRVLKDEINPGLETELVKLGALGVGILESLTAERLTPAGLDGKPIDLGRVGKVTRVDSDHLGRVIAAGGVPVLPPLGLDAAGAWLNLNADDAAAAVAGAMSADRAIFLTDTPGVLRDRTNPASLIPKLTHRECRELIAAGVIDGGMVPKVEACFDALAAGANSALILDGRVPYSLLDVFLSDTFTGTEITK